MKHPFAGHNIQYNIMHHLPCRHPDSKFTPYQSSLNPKQIDPIYAIKHAPGIPKRSYQMLISNRSVIAYRNLKCKFSV